MFIRISISELTLISGMNLLIIRKFFSRGRWAEMARKSRANNVLILSDAKNMMWKAGLYSRLSVEDGDDTEQNSTKMVFISDFRL